MEYNWHWVKALATACGFMVLIGLACCCLTSKPRPHGDNTTSTGACGCDGGYIAVIVLLGFLSLMWLKFLEHQISIHGLRRVLQNYGYTIDAREANRINRVERYAGNRGDT
ncbi:hypothetical protein BUALT_Bualt09G0117400 [Buddleja alternifolia]|uniref:Uncharacterized protein n=1 Tax=Buddleja alternifolia TaxID=168488 RepID=A0AAV6X968_9LAMI|nr:hypothetical protein BUALT_Bualt09G0117400 [Buddleja alternifolia]